MNNKKLSIRVLFPLIMSISIVFCILSCMILFSHYISTYLVRKTIEETSRQKNVLAQNIENEIELYYYKGNTKFYSKQINKEVSPMEQQKIRIQKNVKVKSDAEIGGEK